MLTILLWKSHKFIWSLPSKSSAKRITMLAVAVAISLFGLDSGAALATVVGVLVEVPVMLSLCHIANRTRHWFPNRG